MARINALTGHSYRLGKHLAPPSGPDPARPDKGVWLVSGGDHVACLKWLPGNTDLGPHRAAAVTCERLHAAGSPVPRYHRVDTVDGDGFALMDFMAGHPVLHGGLTPGQARHLLDLIQLQAGAAVLPPAPPDTTVDRILHGDLPARIRAHSAESAELLDRVQAIAGALHGVRLPTGDIIHGDMNPSNLIVDREGGDRITGIIDWAATTRTGDRAADVATILFYLWRGATAEVLWDGLVALTTEDTLRLRVAGLARWSLGAGKLERASWFLDRISA